MYNVWDNRFTYQLGKRESSKKKSCTWCVLLNMADKNYADYNMDFHHRESIGANGDDPFASRVTQPAQPSNNNSGNNNNSSNRNSTVSGVTLGLLVVLMLMSIVFFVVLLCVINKKHSSDYVGGYDDVLHFHEVSPSQLNDVSKEQMSVEVAEPATVDAEPVDAEPVDAEPVDAETVDTEPVDEETVDAETVDAETADAETADAETAIDTATEPSAAVDGKTATKAVKAAAETAQVSAKPASLKKRGTRTENLARLGGTAKARRRNHK
jgi:hypothetical protein